VSQNTVASPKSEAEIWLLRQVRQLDELNQLPDNWDSYGAEPPNAIALSWAKTVLVALFGIDLPPDHVTPSVENGVGISFVHGDRYADVECFNTGEILAVTSTGQGNPTVWEVEKNSVAIESALRKIRDFIRE